MKRTLSTILILALLLCVGVGHAETDIFSPFVLNASGLTYSQWLGSEKTRNMLASRSIIDLSFEGFDIDAMFAALNNDDLYVVQFDSITIGITFFANNQITWLFYTPAVESATYDSTEYTGTSQLMMEQLKKGGTVQNYYTIDIWSVLEDMGTIMEILGL